MSLEKKSIHIRVSPDAHGMLSVMSEFNDKDIAELAARFLEKMIVAEFHDFSLVAERVNRLGLNGKGRE